MSVIRDQRYDTYMSRRYIRRYVQNTNPRGIKRIEIRLLTHRHASVITAKTLATINRESNRRIKISTNQRRTVAMRQ